LCAETDRRLKPSFEHQLCDPCIWKKSRLSASALAIGQYNSYIFHTSSFRFRLGYLREEVMTETNARDEGPMLAALRRRRFYDNDYISFALPPMTTAAEMVEASNAVIAACASGRLTLREATGLISLIMRHAKLIGPVDLEKREATEDDPSSPSYSPQMRI
jgi:hypothetical protein